MTRNNLITVFALCILALLGMVRSEEAAIAQAEESISELYVCNCGAPDFLGKYIISEDHVYDGVPSYVNAKGKSVFRNNGFWYVGDVSSWPLETHYRCVGHENCPMKRPNPPIPGTWTVNRQVGKAPEPVLQTTPCAALLDEL
jgi:hypothetical protein